MDGAIPITTANGEVVVTHQCQVCVQELGIFVWAYILDCSAAVLSLGLLCDEHGFSYIWHPRQPPYLAKGDFKVTCFPSHNVPILLTNILKDDKSVCEANAGRDVQPPTEPGTDPEMQGLVDSSSDEEGWQTAKKRKINKKKTAPPPHHRPPPAGCSAERYLLNGKAVKPRSLG